jgi:hypothetical protein
LSGGVDSEYDLFPIRTTKTPESKCLPIYESSLLQGFTPRNVMRGAAMDVVGESEIIALIERLERLYAGIVGEVLIYV